MGEQVVGIGAGPVGLWQAIQLKKRAPDTDIILYERRAEYVRDNQISLHHRSLTKGVARTYDALEAATTDKLNAAYETPNATLPPWRRLHRVIRAPANVFEEIFREEALARGVRIIYQPVTSLQQLTCAHPECRYFVATDGTHSPIRKDVLGDDDIALERKPIQASIDVQYMVHGQALPIRVATYDKSQYMVAETIGREENGMSRVGLRFLVDDETFNRFPDANASQPLAWRDMPNEIKHHILTFRNLRQQHTDEKVVRGVDIYQISATKVQLSCYAAKQFAVTRQAEGGREVGVFFAGNATLGVPWYRSFNEGVKGASQLAEILARPTASFNDKVKAYADLREPTVTRAFDAAAKKLKFVQLYRSKIRPRLQRAARLTAFSPILVPAAVVVAAGVVVGYIPWKIYSYLNPNARLM